jgi:hypothetical protein
VTPPPAPAPQPQVVVPEEQADVIEEDLAAPPRPEPVPRPPAQGSLRGVTWTPPEDFASARADLYAMHGIGVEAARVPFRAVAERGDLLFEADVLGFGLYVDLPVEYLPATRLRDTLAYASRVLDELLALAAQHPSIRGAGLASAVDTSEPIACGYFEALANPARAAGLWTYYRTRFIESDVCSGTVDAVLIRAHGRPPARLIERWGAVHETPAGIGSLGVRVRDGAGGGHLTPGTQAAQVRFLEDGLRGLRALNPPPAAVFVQGWQGRDHGLITEEGEPRPALAVVQGFFTGRQMVFAVDAGPPPTSAPGATGFMILGWALAFLLIGLMALAPRFRQTVPRYFVRHGYYRESIQRGGGIEGFASLGMMATLVLAAGITGSVIIDSLAGTDVLEVATSGQGETTRERILGVLNSTTALVLLVSVFYAIWLLLNMVWLFALTGRRHRIRPGQALMLVGFSRWPIFVLAVLALLTAQSENPVAWVPWLIWIWVAVEFIAMARMLYDYSRVTRVPMPRAIVLGMAAPIGLALVALLTFVMVSGPEFAFLWNLAMRT